MRKDLLESRHWSVNRTNSEIYCARHLSHLKFSSNIPGIRFSSLLAGRRKISQPLFRVMTSNDISKLMTATHNALKRLFQATRLLSWRKDLSSHLPCRLSPSSTSSFARITNFHKNSNFLYFFQFITLSKYYRQCGRRSRICRAFFPL